MRTVSAVTTERPARQGAGPRHGSGQPQAMQARIKGPRRVGRGGNVLVPFC